MPCSRVVSGSIAPDGQIRPALNCDGSGRMDAHMRRVQYHTEDLSEPADGCAQDPRWPRQEPVDLFAAAFAASTPFTEVFAVVGSEAITVPTQA